MHYSQKRRYYFFIAIAKFKTILSYSLAQACSLCPAAYPSLNLRSTFAQPSLNLRSTFAQPSLNLRSTFAQGSMRRILNFELMGLLGLLGVRAAQADLEAVRKVLFREGDLPIAPTM